MALSIYKEGTFLSLSNYLPYILSLYIFPKKSIYDKLDYYFIKLSYGVSTLFKLDYY